MRWFHRTQRRFSEIFFLFDIRVYFLWPCSLLKDPKYLFSDSTEIRLAKRSTIYRCNSVSGSHISQSNFSESFFPDIIWRYFLFYHSPLWASKYHFANSTRTVLAKGFWRRSCNSLRWFHRTQRSLSECFFLFVMGVYFLWPGSLQRDPKYLFSDSTKIRLAKRSTKYRCNSVSGSHISQSSFCLLYTSPSPRD